jgi:predicted esterase
MLTAIIDQEAARYGMTSDQIAVCGFSQGAVMALAVADTPSAPAEIASIAGRIARPVRAYC